MRRARASASVAVRKAETSDDDAIRRLLVELGYPLDARTLAERLERAAAEPSIRAFVAARDEAVVGFASLHVLHLIERPPLGRLSAIVVASSERRAGAGNALVERVEEEARAAGCDRLEVTSGEWRGDAHAFYRALGFQETSKRFIKDL
jgi:N-acetylglutamate synthase-like GNAT family acetyltransferase